MVSVVAAQAIKRHAFPLDENLNLGRRVTETDAVPLAEEEEPYRKIDRVSVYHVARNKPRFEEKEFDVRKLHRWGYLDHPAIVACSYEIGGDLRFYLDTRIAGFYLLWTATRVDDQFEFPGVSYDLVAWTPRIKGDAIQRAGFRLVHAAMLEILCVTEGEWHCGHALSDGMAGSKEVAMLIGAIASTIHKSRAALQRHLASLPEYLCPLYEEGATIGEKECLYK